MNTVSVRQARSNLSQLLELAFYKGAQISVERNNKPMARIIGEPFMTALESLLEESPNLQETLEIMMDKELMNLISLSEKDVEQGNTLPLETILD